MRASARALLAVVALVAGLMVGLAAPAAAATPDDHRQLWVWHPDRAADLVALARRDDVDELLVWVAPGFTRRPGVVATVTRIGRLARAEGIAVTALGGDPRWALHPDVAAAWAREVAGSGLFPALHLDIEPHALPEWGTDRDRAARGLLAALTAARRTGLPVAADVPAWFGDVRVDGARLDDAVLRRVDGVTVMAYRDTVARVLSAARPTLTRAARFGVPATIGVEIGPVSEPGTSMAGISRADLLAALTAIGDGATAAGWTTYAGTAVHDADHLALLG